ncbi:MAG: hypothetical protein VX278_18215 [Myxococcota bacterium]|nr:hypothetical protein [Myxococcota bacterium]
MQQSIFTCRYLFQGGTLSTAVWLRLPLHQYSFSKSLRRLINRNAKKFDVSISRYQNTPEKERLYQRYKSNFQGRLSDSLYESLGLDREVSIFQSLQTEVRYDGKLVAFSVFDTGSRSLQSICGIYEPSLSKYSLGLYTMLLEVKYGVENGMEYFYPGYIAPGRTVFDYKLRTRGTEYFEPADMNWYPIAQLDREDLPSESMIRKLKKLQEYLSALRIDNQLYIYPPYQVVASDKRMGSYLATPLYVECIPFFPSRESLFVYWDVISNSYVAGRYIAIRDLEERFFVEPSADIRQSFTLYRIINAYFESDSLDEIIEYVSEFC